MSMQINTETRSAKERFQLDDFGESQTKQYFKDECDINNIVQKFQETGQLPANLAENYQYADAPDLDLKTALDLVKNARHEFDELSEEIKANFDHDPDKYFRFLELSAEGSVTFSNEFKQKPDTPGQEKQESTADETGESSE